MTDVHSEEKASINALLQKDLLQYIHNLGLEKELENGNIACENCNEVLQLEQIGTIFFVDEEPHFTCNKPICYEFVRMLNENY